MKNSNTILESPIPVITPEGMLNHWQGHRKVTRKVIEAFPEDKLFDYAIGGMRPFAQLALEMIRMSEPGINGIVSGNWRTMDQVFEARNPTSKAELLQMWDDVTEQIDALWPQIPAARFLEIDTAFGQYEGPVYGTLLYFIDNEIHHRGQGYVYLRSLGIQPPAFWDRS
jgi:uncharacterized damage-inducible protein DinB